MVLWKYPPRLSFKGNGASIRSHYVIIRNCIIKGILENEVLDRSLTSTFLGRSWCGLEVEPSRLLSCESILPISLASDFHTPNVNWTQNSRQQEI